MVAGTGAAGAFVLIRVVRSEIDEAPLTDSYMSHPPIPSMRIATAATAQNFLASQYPTAAPATIPIMGLRFDIGGSFQGLGWVDRRLGDEEISLCNFVAVVLVGEKLERGVYQ